MLQTSDLNHQKELIYSLASELLSNATDAEIDACAWYYEDKFVDVDWEVDEIEAEDCGFVNAAGEVDFENFKKACENGFVVLRTSYKGDGMDLEVLNERKEEEYWGGFSSYEDD